MWHMEVPLLFILFLCWMRVPASRFTSYIIPTVNIFPLPFILMCNTIFTRIYIKENWKEYVFEYLANKRKEMCQDRFVMKVSTNTSGTVKQSTSLSPIPCYHNIRGTVYLVEMFKGWRGTKGNRSEWFVMESIMTIKEFAKGLCQLSP